MAVLELKGKIAAVLPTETVGTNNLKKQVVMFNVPGYVDGFGDKKGKDELWALSVLGDKIDELSLNGSLCDRNAVVKCFINSKTYTRDKEPDMYFIEAVIAKITLMPEK